MNNRTTCRQAESTDRVDFKIWSARDVIGRYVTARVDAIAGPLFVRPHTSKCREHKVKLPSWLRDHTLDTGRCRVQPVTARPPVVQCPHQDVPHLDVLQITIWPKEILGSAYSRSRVIWW